MTEPDIAHIELDVERGVDPISGQLRAADGRDRTFAGMLELIALLDRARATRGDEDGENAR
jgi:hypothetical protein